MPIGESLQVDDTRDHDHGGDHHHEYCCHHGTLNEELETESQTSQYQAEVKDKDNDDYHSIHLPFGFI